MTAGRGLVPGKMTGAMFVHARGGPGLTRRLRWPATATRGLCSKISS